MVKAKSYIVRTAVKGVKMNDLSYLFFQVAGMLLAYVAPFLMLILIVYILSAIALYRMAMKFHYPYAWLAWIPLASTYLMFVLPVKKYKVLAINKEFERQNAFWIYLGCAAGCMILSFIPIINVLAGIALIIVMIFFQYPLMKDLYALFVDDSTAKTYSILSLVIPGSAIIFLLIMAGKEPRDLAADV